MNKAFLALGVAGILTYTTPTMPIKAVSAKSTQTISNDTENLTRAAGLITRCDLRVSTSNNSLYINGITQANGSMKSIGFKDISIEYSSDNVNWDKEKPIDDITKSGSSYYLNDYSVSVNGGYYYRVSLNHYAKESGLFGSSQSVSNTSNSVWID